MYKKSDRKKGLVTFEIKPPKPAKEVLLSGDFTNWVPTPMKKLKDGSFSTSISLESGTHEYKFVVDGQWAIDPDNVQTTWNPLGTMNSVAGID